MGNLSQISVLISFLFLTFIIFIFIDAHAPASLLKLWYRELYDPLIPDELYDECVNTEDPDKAKAIVDKLPDLNKLVSLSTSNCLSQHVTCKTAEGLSP